MTGTDPAANPSSLSWDTAWRGDLGYLFDMQRGIEILRLKGGPSAAATMATVRDPRPKSDPLAAQPVRSRRGIAFICPAFKASAAARAATRAGE